MFFLKKKVKQQKKIRFSDVDCIVMGSEGMHFELLPRKQIVKYRNVISPRDGGMRFPDGYFIEKEATIPQDTMNQISAIIDRMFSSQILENELNPFHSVPAGFSSASGAYMQISYLGNTAYYTNKHPTEDGFMIRTEPVAAEYSEVFQLLMKHCTFPVNDINRQ